MGVAGAAAGGWAAVVGAAAGAGVEQLQQAAGAAVTEFCVSFMLINLIKCLTDHCHSWQRIHLGMARARASSCFGNS